MTTLKTNMLKKGKKGFTLTELAIVIAVIAILIAVLVPTFTSVINNARRTTAAETAKNALTEYTIETYSAVPDGSYVINGDYCWEVTDGTFTVNDNITLSDGDTFYTANTIQYSWGSDADSGITDVELYVSYTAGISSTATKVIAQNAISNYAADSSNTERVITYIGVPNGTSESSVNGKASAAVKLTAGETNTTYYYYTVSEGAITGTTTTKPTADFTDEDTYAGVIIGYTSGSQTAEKAEAGMKAVSNLSAGTYYVKVTTANEYTYYYSITCTIEEDKATWGDATLLSDSALYGTKDGTEVTAYTAATVYYKTQEEAATEVAEAAAKAIAEVAAEEADTEDSNEYTYATVTVDETTYYFELSGENGIYTAKIDNDASEVNSSSYTKDDNASFTATDGYTVALYKNAKEVTE